MACVSLARRSPNVALGVVLKANMAEVAGRVGGLPAQGNGMRAGTPSINVTLPAFCFSFELSSYL